MIFHFVSHKIPISAFFHRHTWLLTELLSCTFCQQRFLKIHFQLIKEVFLLYSNESSVISSWCLFEIRNK